MNYSQHSHLLVLAFTVTLLCTFLFTTFQAGGQDGGAAGNQFLEKKGDFFRITQETTYIDRGEAEGIMCNVYESALDSASVSPKNLIYHGAQYVTGSGIFYLQNVTKEKTVYDVETIEKRNISDNGTEEVDYDVIRTERKVNVTEEEWVQDMPVMNPGECIRVKFVTYMKPMLGDRRVEYVPELLGMKYEEYGWFNISYAYRRPVYARCTSCGSTLTNLTFLVNDSAIYIGSTPQYVWINALLNSTFRMVAYIYYNDETDYVFVDETDNHAIPFDVDSGNRSGVFGVWPTGNSKFYDNVHHFADSSLNNSANMSEFATMTGATLNASSKIQNGAQVDSYEEYITTPFSFKGDLTVGENFTMSLWYKAYPSCETWEAIFGDSNGSGCDDNCISINNNKTMCNVYSTYSTSSIFHCDGNWHHVVCGAANASGSVQLNFYVDGINATTTVSSELKNRYYNSKVSPRYSTGEQHLDGEVDELRIEKRAISEAEVIFMFNNTIGTHNMSYLGQVEYKITFHIYSGETGENLTSVNAYCNNSWSGTLDSGDTVDFGPGTYSCMFEKTSPQFYNKTVVFTVNNDTTLEVSMSLKGELTNEEHTWLEYLYNCWSSGGCRESLDNIETMIVYINQTATQINETVNKVWDHFKQTDESVVLKEEMLSSVVNSTSNITINYSINVPVKEGYQFLPIRIFYWFLDESNTTCFNQAKQDGDAESPVCTPLVAHEVGETQRILNFTVDLRPSLPAGSYTLVRRIEIDPENVWTNYGHEAIGMISVMEDSGGSEAGAVSKEGNIPVDEGKPESAVSDGQKNPEEKINAGAAGMATGTGQTLSPSGLVLIISCIMLVVIIVCLFFARKKK